MMMNFIITWNSFIAESNYWCHVEVKFHWREESLSAVCQIMATPNYLCNYYRRSLIQCLLPFVKTRRWRLNIRHTGNVQWAHRNRGSVAKKRIAQRRRCYFNCLLYSIVANFDVLEECAALMLRYSMISLTLEHSWELIAKILTQRKPFEYLPQRCYINIIIEYV